MTRNIGKEILNGIVEIKAILKTSYYVSYELEVHPSNVIVELRCHDLEDQKEVYEDRRNRHDLKKVKMFTKEN